MKKGYKGNIETLTLENENFRKVLYTAQHCQLVLMSLLPGEEIGKVIIDGTEYIVTDGDAVVVPSGANHNVINTSDTEELKLYTIYSPAHHKDGMVRKTKEEAVASDPEFDGVTTEY
jgi:5-keto 4-deoxyuronate isomerase